MAAIKRLPVHQSSVVILIGADLSGNNAEMLKASGIGGIELTDLIQEVFCNDVIPRG